MGEIWGVKVSTSPPSPSISLRQISEIFRPRAGLVPGYNARDFGKSAGNVAGDIFTFELAPGPAGALNTGGVLKNSPFSTNKLQRGHVWAP